MTSNDSIQRIPIPTVTDTATVTLRASAMVAAVGFIAWLAGLLIDPRRALAAYLFAYAAVATIVVGALIQVMLSHVTGAHWFTTIRRTALNIASSAPVIAILVLPILIGIHQLYSWTTPSTLSADAYKNVMHKRAWLNVPFFVIRTVIYVSVWTALSAMLRRWSLRQDTATGDAVVTITRKQRRLSAIGIVVAGFTLTFAAFDWLMSLEPTWYSTIYGVYIFAGGFLAALALIACHTYVASRDHNPLSLVISPNHFGSLGTLILTFVVFWGYIAFAQYFIIWIGDIPADASWYVIRTSGSWGDLALAIAIGQFAIPFVCLLSRALRRRPIWIAAVGAWLILMHLLDMYWVILPAIHPAGINVSWLDFAALFFVGGCVAAVAAWRARNHAAVPVGDPYLTTSIQYAEP